MKTLDECKDEVARYFGYKDFKEAKKKAYLSNELVRGLDKVCEIYAEQFKKPLTAQRPVEEILKSESHLKKLFHLYVGEGYVDVPYKVFKKALIKEGLEGMRGVVRIIQGIEDMGYTFKKEDI